jgi:hypothetical protein
MESEVMGYATNRSPLFRPDRRKRQEGRGVRSKATWRDPFLRARRAIDSTLEGFAPSGRVIDASFRFGLGGPVEQRQRLVQLATWLDQTIVRLERAIRGMEKWAERSPDYDYAQDFTFPFIGAACRCMQLLAWLEDLHARAAEAWAKVVHASPRHPRFVSIIVRRWPVAFTTVADAARKVSRGRAPPLS